ncbi:hypothetical protein TURU_141295 [Turdus rufiventris]|nr:hypothetical protein TURU_141295 [Turdus rufiventris]
MCRVVPAELSSLKKFDEIKKANQAAAKKLVEDQLSSSSEDDDEDAEIKQGKILDKTFTIYTSQTDGDASELERTRQYMNEAFQSGAMTCLICIASVKRNQAVWSCCGCFCIFHLVCIQKWAKDSLFLVSSPLTDDDFGKKDYPWPWCVGNVCHVAITHVKKFVMLVPVETVLVLGKGPVRVEKQSLHCLVQKMCPPVVIVVIKFWNVASINVHSAVIGVPVKYADSINLQDLGSSHLSQPSFKLHYHALPVRFLYQWSVLDNMRKLTCADLKEKELLISCRNQCPKEIKEAEAKAALEEEKRRQQAELEAFENRLKGRRKNKRRKDEVEVEQSSWQKYKNLIMLPVFGVAVVMVAWLMVYND